MGISRKVIEVEAIEGDRSAGVVVERTERALQAWCGMAVGRHFDAPGIRDRGVVVAIYFDGDNGDSASQNLAAALDAESLRLRI